jgi:hypothetical protein
VKVCEEPFHDVHAVAACLTVLTSFRRTQPKTNGSESRLRRTTLEGVGIIRIVDGGLAQGELSRSVLSLPKLSELPQLPDSAPPVSHATTISASTRAALLMSFSDRRQYPNNSAGLPTLGCDR